ncbi:MAG: TetR/AcrR family transcriptional regulator [Gallintestinimicrobium sp.]
MNDKFFDLKQEKQDRMINASLKIFSRGGYRHASTDEIVKEAGISKGLLFHYFGSKLGLYGFLFDYSARFMLLELSREVKRSETDYFALTKQMEQARMQVMKLYPYMQRFLDVAVKEETYGSGGADRGKEAGLRGSAAGIQHAGRLQHFCTIRGFCACDKNGALYDRRADR